MAALGIFVCFGLPLIVLCAMGPEAINDGTVITGMMAVGSVVFLMGCLCTIKNLLSWFFDFLLITFGAMLLLIAAFARPLGLYDGEATTVENLFSPGTEIEAEGQNNDSAAEPQQPDQSATITLPPHDSGVVEPILGDGLQHSPQQAQNVIEQVPSVKEALAEYQKAAAELQALEEKSLDDIDLNEPEGLESFSEEEE